MSGWTLCFVLLLSLTVCCVSEVTLVKTIQNKPDVTPLCTNDTVNTITLIVCKISTERSRGEVCKLLFHYKDGFQHECDSRFTLTRENQTVFLYLTSLTPEDSGNYKCECSHPGGTFILRLNITVEEDEDSHTPMGITLSPAVIGVTITIIITAVILGYIHTRTRRRRQTETLSSELNREPQDIEPYSTFIRRESGLYSTVKMQNSNTNAHNSYMFT